MARKTSFIYKKSRKNVENIRVDASHDNQYDKENIKINFTNKN